MTDALASRVPPSLPPAAFLKIVTLLAVIFMLLVGWSTWLASRPQETVPLNPCRQCANQCPCPRMNGSVRCGCPN